jgi:hypothetical protein
LQVVEGHIERTPGLFRIPGQTRKVTSLKDYFLAHMYIDPSIERIEHIEVTSRFAALPNPVITFHYNIHDVASTFKSFLQDLQGGILGSVDLFDNIKKGLNVPQRVDEDMDFQCCGLANEDDEKSEVQNENLKWVAMALCNVECHWRRNLIFAVFGVLAYLKHDKEKAKPRDSFFPTPVEGNSPYIDTPAGFGYQMLRDRCKQVDPNAEVMSSESLAVVFAPVLLGNYTEHIKIDKTKLAIANIIQAHHRLSSGSPRKKAQKSISTMHLRPQSLNMNISAEYQHHFLASGKINSTLPVGTLESHLSYPAMPRSTKRIMNMGRRRDTLDSTLRDELGEAGMRNDVAVKIIELLLKNWEGIIREVRRIPTRGE